MEQIPLPKETPHNTKPLGGLYYIVGASGAGKDSIMQHLLEGDKENELMIAERYITRETLPGDGQIELSPAQFEEHLETGLFLFSWAAHGCQYGIAKTVLADVSAGRQVLVNGSRAYIQISKEIYPSVKVVGIRAEVEHLSERIKKRGRDLPTDIDERIARNQAFASQLSLVNKLITNDGAIEGAVSELRAYLSAP
ncbi:MAG: hypothetical protein V3V09_00115 [Arenicellales bacterium]